MKISIELGRYGDKSDLTSPAYVGYTSMQCMRFWYWRHVSQSNRIDVLTIGTAMVNPNLPIWSSNYTFPSKMWHRAQLPIVLRQGMQIKIRANQLGNKTNY